MIRPVIASLLVVACPLAATLAWELGAFSTRAPADLPHPRAQVAQSAAAAPDHTAEWVGTILARPLLSPDRRPIAVSAADAGGDRAAPEGLPRLTAVLVGPFGRNAIFAMDGSKPLVVTEGGRVNAWTIQSIDVDAVRVSGPGGTVTLHPSFTLSPAAPGSSASAGQRTALSPRR